VLVVDETGFIKKGIPSVGVQRQYSGTAGKVDNCQLGVFLAYASGRGRAFIDPGAVPAALVDQRPGAGRRGTVPEQVGSRTKPQLARVMLERALDAEVPGRPGRLSPGRARRGFPQLLVRLGLAS
jgi:SRSO17 transposase